MSSYQPRAYWTALHDSLPMQLSAVGYPGMGEGFNRGAYALRLAAAERLISRNLGDSVENVVEGAVGVGAYAHLWRHFGVRSWTGLDISATAIANLQTQHPTHHFRAIDLASTDAQAWETLPVGKESQQLVTAIDVLYHLVDDPAFVCALTRLASYVAPGGLMVLSDVFVPAQLRLAAHVTRRPLSTYAALLEPLGFTLVDREPIFAVLGDPVRRTGIHLTDEMLFFIWRILSKGLQLTPGPLRNATGRLAVRALAPLDAQLRRSGLATGINLELAAFRREPRGEDV